MLKKIIVLLAGLVFCSNATFANETKVDNSFERQFKNSGYISPEKAIANFEKINVANPKIPKNINNLLPFKVTHTFGQYKGKNDQHLRLEYINEYSKALFVILVFPLNQEIPFNNPDIIGNLSDKSLYKVKKEGNFYHFQFKTEKFSYILSSNFLGENKNIEEKDFIAIAKAIKQKNKVK
jgi:hypothetical protein